MRRARQLGFTLYEIAFSGAVIALLVFFVIGQHLTMDLKAKRLEHDLQSIQTAIYNSQERLRPAPGNFHKASLRLTDSGALGNYTNWKAIVGENWEPTSGETFNLWQNVLQPRPGYAKASIDKNSNAYVPLKSSVGITDVSKASSAPITGLAGNYIICANGIAGTLVKQLDLEMDDGDTASGSMMISSAIGGAGIATDSITEDTTYLVCLGV